VVCGGDATPKIIAIVPMPTSTLKYVMNGTAFFAFMSGQWQMVIKKT
jgi:hypothetical protein